MVLISATDDAQDTLIHHTQDSHTSWEQARERFLERISPGQQAVVRQSLGSVHCGGSGLRDWVSAIAFRQAPLPDRIPEAVIDVYLVDSEAAPLHDCEQCGLAVPVRPNRLHGMESEPEEQYFSACPLCGGRTGPYYFWSKKSDGAASLASELRRKKPR